MLDLFLDFETRYDSLTGYSLKTMPTQAYLRDARQRTLGVALALDDRPPVWIPAPAVRETLARLPWRDIRVIAHNVDFDAAVLADCYGIVPAAVGCTQALATWSISQGHISPQTGVSLAELAALVPGTGPKGNLDEALRAQAAGDGGAALASYAMRDVAICRALWRKYASQWPAHEQAIAQAHTLALIRRPWRLDRGGLQALADAPQDERAIALRQNRMFAAALTACGVTVPSKPGKRKPIPPFAKTDPFMQSLEGHPDARVRALHSLRVEGGSNITRTRAARLLSCIPADWTGGERRETTEGWRCQSFGAPLAYHAAATGRFQGRDLLNMANLPARRPEQRALRSALLPPPGFKLLVVDSAQIECRVLAWGAQCLPLETAFAAKRDVYVEFAAVLYNKPTNQITKQERAVAKAAVLGLGYGMGADRFSAECAKNDNPLSMDMAQQTVATYRNAYPEIPAFWRSTEQQLRTGVLGLPSGRKLIYPDIQSHDRQLTYQRPTVFARIAGDGDYRTKIWGGHAVENWCQAVARDVVMWQILLTNRRLPEAQLALSCYDEGVFVVPESVADSAKKIAIECFTSLPAWARGLHVGCEAVIVDNYGEAK